MRRFICNSKMLPLSVLTVLLNLCACNGAGVRADETNFDVYGKENRRVLVLLHGFMSRKEHHALAAAYLASKGTYVIVPALSYGLLSSNHEERAVALRHFISRLRAGEITGFRPSHVFLAGHSAGGLTALLAADDVEGIVLLDAVIFAGRPGNRERITNEVLSRIRVPVLSIEAPPDSCNYEANQGLNLAVLLSSAPVRRVRIPEASHCDFMDSHAGCRFVCGEGSESARATALSLLASFIEEHSRLTGEALRSE